MYRKKKASQIKVDVKMKKRNTNATKKGLCKSILSINVIFLFHIVQVVKIQTKLTTGVDEEDFRT